MNDLINKISLRFESGNSVPVDSVRIAREEWEKMLRMDKILRSSVRDEFKTTTSAVGAVQNEISTLEQERDTALEREQALEAHVERLRAGFDGAVTWEDVREVFSDLPSVSLARRDLIKQAEALEEAYKNTDDAAAQDYLYDTAAEKRQRAQLLK